MTSETYNVFFTNLANPLKIEIILCLREKERNVTELSKLLKVEQSKISHALIPLKCCNIVKVEQKGKQRIYSLNKKTIIPILKLIDEHALKNCGKTCSCGGKK
jgi:ArsR family transcriptional regulator, zinc-responsive transcriptional repressor